MHLIWLGSKLLYITPTRQLAQKKWRVSACVVYDKFLVQNTQDHPRTRVDGAIDVDSSVSRKLTRQQ